MKKIVMLVLTMVLLLGLNTEAFSWGGHYRYREGRYFRSEGLFGLGGFIAGLAVGAFVATIPPRYETVVIGGVPYYYADGYYYQVAPGGYVVVAPPVVQGQFNTSMNSSPIIYVAGTLVVILLLLGIILMLKNLFAK